MNALEKIAIAMHSVAEATGQATHELERGLVLVLRHRAAGGWVLSLGRLGAPPAELEETICRAAFGVPVTARRREVVRPNKYQKDYFITGFIWGPQIEQLSFAGPVEGPHQYQRGL